MIKKILKFLWDALIIIGIFLLFIVISLQYYVHANDEVLKNSQTYSSLKGNYISKIINERILSLLSRPPKEINYSEIYQVNYTEIENEVKFLNLSYQEEGQAQSIVVLNYHGIVEDGFEDGYSLSVENFKAHMYALKEKGYQTATVNDLYLFMRGEKPLPKKSIVITFDDGVRSTYYYADPILKALDYKAVMFVVTGYSFEKNNSRYYLNKEELTQMQESGRWDIEAHSYLGHNRRLINQNDTFGPFYSNKLWIEGEERLETNEEYLKRISYDLKKAKQDIETNLNKTVMGFALPFGDFAQRESNYQEASIILLEEMAKNYKMVFYQFKPAINKDFKANYNDKISDFYLVMRISTDTIHSPEELLKQIESAEAIELPYAEKFDDENRWVTISGIKNITNKITLSNPKNTTLAMAYLDGSYLWRNYNYSVILDSHEAENIFLLARFQDAANYVGCKYTNSSIQFIVVGQTKGIIERVKLSDNFLKKEAQLRMRVNENEVTCSFDNQSLQVTSELIPSHGGVGFRVEGFQTAESQVSFKEIKISQLNKEWDFL